MKFLKKLFNQEDADMFEHDLDSTDGCHDDRYEEEC